MARRRKLRIACPLCGANMMRLQGSDSGSKKDQRVCTADDCGLALSAVQLLRLVALRGGAQVQRDDAQDRKILAELQRVIAQGQLKRLRETLPARPFPPTFAVR